MIQGTDIKVRFTITDGTNAIPPSTLDAYAINIYYFNEFGDKVNVATYKSTNTTFYDIVVYNDATGKVDIVINRELTKTIKKGIVYGEVFIKETSTSEFIAAKSVNGVSSINLFTMETSSNVEAL